MQDKKNERIKRKMRAFLKKELQIKNAELRHIHTMGYVVGYAAPSCLIVYVCWAEAEEQCKDFEKKNPLQTVRVFDKSLKAGDWCSYAYFSDGSRGEQMVIPIVA
jgi:hypothetical protein